LTRFPLRVDPRKDIPDVDLDDWWTAVALLPGESTVRYLGIEVDDVLGISEQRDDDHADRLDEGGADRLQRGRESQPLLQTDVRAVVRGYR
jgi:hypothetical protein